MLLFIQARDLSAWVSIAFKYIICYCSSSKFLYFCISVFHLNTSYVTVHLGVGSNKYISGGDLNTSYVTVHLYAEVSQMVKYIYLNTSYVTVHP